MFHLKKIVSQFFYPVPLVVMLLAAGTVMLWAGRARPGRALVTLAALVLALTGLGAFSDGVLAPLEQRYPPLGSDAAPPAVSWIVVLGGGCHYAPHTPVSSHLSESSLVRLVEGLRLQRRLDGSRLVLTGGAGAAGGRPVAAAMADVACALGADPADIVVEPLSRDTGDHPRYVKAIVGEAPFLLVTSALHMRRAVAEFERSGMRPIPAPTHYLAAAERPFLLLDLFPSNGGLEKTQRAVHEYLGLLWLRLKGANSGRTKSTI